MAALTPTNEIQEVHQAVDYQSGTRTLRIHYNEKIVWLTVGEDDYRRYVPSGPR